MRSEKLFPVWFGFLETISKILMTIHSFILKIILKKS